MEYAIRTGGLTKYYGSQLGIEDLELEVRRGEVFGFLGPNGAGKTTTIRLLLDLIRPTRGRADVLGLDPRTDAERIHRLVGYVPGDVVLYPRLTGRQLVGYFAHLRGEGHLPYAEELAERFGLDLERRISDLSRGNRQKVALVQALMHRPELLILDEPTAGLDPLMQQEFEALMRELADEGRTVFLSSHILDEVQDTADRAAIIREGHLVATEDVDALRQRALRRVEIRFADRVPKRPFTGLPGVSDLEIDGSTLRCTLEGDADALVKAAAAHHVVSITSGEPDLESLFLSYYRGEATGAA